MKNNQISELARVLAQGKDKGLELSFVESTLTLRRSIDKAEYLWWIVLIIGVPIYYLLKSPSIQAIIIALSLSFGFIYLIYDRFLTTNQLFIDFVNKEITVTPNYKIIKDLGLVKEKKIRFNEIQSISLGQKSNGRGQSPRRRLFIETNIGKEIPVVDFKNTKSAELFDRFLKDLLTN